MNNKNPSLKDILDKTTLFFREKGLSSPRLDAELLLSHGLNKKDRVGLYMSLEQPLTNEELATCRNLVKRRSLGEPVAYLIGKKDFYGLTFDVNPSTLIPRPETELIVETVLEWIKNQNPIKLCILDIGAGSGCIGLALVHSILKLNSTRELQSLSPLPTPRLFSIEVSPEACSVIERNAKKLNLETYIQTVNSSFEDFVKTDLINNPTTQPNIIVSNPPYIDSEDSSIDPFVSKYEPHLALFADDQGFKKIKDWSMYASKLISSNGICAFEIGYNQGQKSLECFKELSAFKDVKILKDFSSHDRVVVAQS